MTNSLAVSMLKPRMVMEQAGKAIQRKLYVEANGQVPEKCFVAGPGRKFVAGERKSHGI